MAVERYFRGGFGLPPPPSSASTSQNSLTTLLVNREIDQASSSMYRSVAVPAISCLRLNADQDSGMAVPASSFHRGDPNHHDAEHYEAQCPYSCSEPPSLEVDSRSAGCSLHVPVELEFTASCIPRSPMPQKSYDLVCVD
ncbi:hypothetical protein Q8A73_009057 [Channa argus]|nr:hypothetical protein Q8A73_009057 [Channa argus]